MSYKGKGIAIGDEGYPGKRKRGGGEDDKTGRRKRTHPGVLQFFEDSAYEVDESDSDGLGDFFNDDDFLQEGFETDVKVKNEPEKASQFPLFPKEEEMSEEELEKMLDERYKPGSSFVRYAEDGYEATGLTQRYTLNLIEKDPTVWKVKCMVGRERHSAFCLMQKFVDVHSLGTKLQIVSAFAVEHVKGFIFIEAYRQSDINEACKGICSIYCTRVVPIPQNEASHLFSVRPKYCGISVGTWARVKSGKYKGDLAEVVTVNEAQKKATVKLIPRIDMQAMAAKFGGGVTVKKSTIPAPRLISSRELEDFRPLIQCRRDRDTGNIFEVFDGMMLKDGYLYKKVSMDSLSFFGVMPSEDELLKFEPSKNGESNDVEWLSGLFGERKKKQASLSSDKGGEKGEASSSSSLTTFFEKHDLVFFGRTGFGVVIGTDKDDRFRVLKEGTEGPIVVTVELRLLKKASFDKKFTALDNQKKTISINDTIRVLEGPLEDRQGIVKQIYRGTIFFHDENEQENGGYSCAKAQICEKVELSGDACKQKGGKSEPGGKSEAFSFEDFPSSPKSPLSPKKPWQGRENNCFNREDKDGMFTVGQSLRIRVGPLKGYLCRVMAIRRTDITVKLDSQQRILTVKAENLAEVRGKSSGFSTSEDLTSAKPFELLGTEDRAGGWLDGAGTSTEGGGWNTGGPSTERSSWSSFPSSNLSLQPESTSANLENVGASAWETKGTLNQKSSWGAGATVVEDKDAMNTEQGGWGKTEGSWDKSTTTTDIGASGASKWGTTNMSTGDQAGPSTDTGDNWGKNKVARKKQNGGWAKSEEPEEKGISGNATSSWGIADTEKTPADSWGKGRDYGSSQTTWGKAAESLHADSCQGLEDSWGKAADKLSSKDGPSGSKSAWNNSSAAPSSQTGIWGNAENLSAQPNAKGLEEDSWGKAAEKSSFKDVSSGSKSAWNTYSTSPASQDGSWGNPSGISGQPTAEASGWKKDVGVSRDQINNWGSLKKDGENTKSWGKGGSDNQGKDSWSKPKAFGADGGSSWNKQDGGSSWSKPSGGDRDGRDDGRNWISSGSFEGGRGSGGRRGRGGRGGRDNFGRGRSFDQDQSTGNVSSWGGGRGGGGSWANNRTSDEGNRDYMEASGGRKKGADQMGDQSSSWGGKKKEGEDATGWGKSGFGNQGQSEGWNKTGAPGAGGELSWSKQDGGSSCNKQVGASSWGKQDGGFTSKQDGGSSWNKQEGGSSWGKHDGGSSWNKQEGGSSWGKQDGGSSWNKQEGGSSSGKQDGGFTSKQDGGSSWNKQEGGSSWGKQDGGFTSKHDGGSSWNKQEGGSSWGKQDGGFTSKQDGGSSWNNRGGGSTWGNQGGGSSWGKQDGGSSWSKPPAEDQGGTNSQNNWGRSGRFEGGRGSGGRRGRGGHGGRDNFGRGRSFDQDQSTGNMSIWGGGGGGAGWGSSKAVDGGSKDDMESNQGGSSWNKQGGGSSWGNQGGGSSWGNQGGGSSWGKKDFGNDRGGGFEGGHGFGGRRGRGGDDRGRRGGRDNFGRGRSFDREQSGWSSGKTGGWGNNKDFDGGRKDDGGTSGWKNASDGAGDQMGNWGCMKKEGDTAKGWGNGGSSGWGNSKPSDGGNKDDTGASDWKNAASDSATGWGKGGSGGQDSWSKPKTFGAEGGSSWSKQDSGSGRKDDGADGAGWGNSKPGSWGDNNAPEGDKQNDAAGGWG